MEGLKHIQHDAVAKKKRMSLLQLSTGSIRRWERLHGFASRAQRGEQAAVYFDAGVFFPPPAGRRLIGREPKLHANRRPVHRSFLRVTSLNGPSEHPRQKHGYDEYYININNSMYKQRRKK